MKKRPSRILNETEVRIIREKYYCRRISAHKWEHNLIELAKAFDVSQNTIRKVANRQTHAGVPDAR